MAKSNRWQKALTVLSRGGVFSAEDLCKEMQYNSVYRVSSIVLDTKIFAGAVIKTVRSGRKVTGYQLVNVDEMKKLVSDKGFVSLTSKSVAKQTATVAKVAKVVAVKSAKVPKSPKQSKAPSVEMPTKVKTIAPVDVLDMIDTGVADFEDREYASQYVKGM